MEESANTSESGPKAPAPSLFSRESEMPQVSFSFKQRILKGEVSTTRMPPARPHTCICCRRRQLYTAPGRCDRKATDATGLSLLSTIQDMALAATPVRLPGRDNLEFQVFAVFDGHSGDKTAKFCKKHLVKEFLPRLPDTQMPSEDNKAAFEVYT